MDRASQPDCPACGAQAGPAGNEATDDYLSRHLCRACGVPRALTNTEDPFRAFGLERRFSIDPALLEKRFYEISRGLHPDRFAALGGGARKNSIDRMTFLNDAYGTLKDPEKRREWLLRFFQQQASPTSFDPSRKPQLPPDLAEAWFELQEAISDESSGVVSGAAIAEFETRLGTSRTIASERIRLLETQADLALQAGNAPDPEILSRMRKESLSRSYLSSLERDVERLKKRLFIA